METNEGFNESPENIDQTSEKQMKLETAGEKAAALRQAANDIRAIIGRLELNDKSTSMMPVRNFESLARDCEVQAGMYEQTTKEDEEYERKMNE